MKELDKNDGGAHKFSRRQFVRVGSLGMLTLGLAACSDSDDDDDGEVVPEPTPQVVTPSPAYFPQSVATGDPRPDSVIFWTRIFDEADPSSDYAVQLMVGLDEELTNVIAVADLTAAAEFDHVVKLKLMQLSPYTTYYYQFVYSRGGSSLGSNVGRTRTAASPDMDVPARFAVVSCQDYRDRYYNVLAEIAKNDDLDFVVHLGDYIYETTAGATTEDPTDPATRVVTFSAPEEAIQLGNNFAARSLGNYRDIYKTYRADAALQRMHERHPMIAIWDDHEFSNDSWQDNGNYLNGLTSEQDTDRRLNAERAYAEYMPLDFGLNNQGILVDGDEAYYPFTRIYRDFQFGQHLHLLLTDTRTFRPDHIVPEDAFPGEIAVDQPTLQAVLASQGVDWDQVAPTFAAYVNIDDPNYAFYKVILQGGVTLELIASGLSADVAQATAAQKVTGNVAVQAVNLAVLAYNQNNPSEPIPALGEEGLPRGLAYLLVGKTSTLSGFGSRNFLLKPTFDLLSAVKFALSGGASEDALGQDQENWLIDALTNSTATWRILGNSIPMNSMVVDFSTYPVPAPFNNAFYIGVDHWDGFPNKRKQLLETIAQVAPRTLAIAGDVHSSHVTHHGNGIYEFTTTSVSSATIKDLVTEVGQQPPFNTLPGFEALLANINQLLLNGHPRMDDGATKLKYTNADVHGFVVIEVAAAGVSATYHHIDTAYTASNHYDNPALSSLFNRLVFRVTADGQFTTSVG